MDFVPHALLQVLNLEITTSCGVPRDTSVARLRKDVRNCVAQTTEMNPAVDTMG